MNRRKIGILIAVSVAGLIAFACTYQVIANGATVSRGGRTVLGGY
ncbi:MAG: hypothetical protein JWQ02_4284 [Capsulimonas sp.]|nr:hypothetical protein [Capsulimonas sp.]